MAELLSIVDVDKSYGRRGQRLRVLTNVSLSVARGEIVGLVGSGGAGRTTLLRVTAGMVRPDSGQVRLAETYIAGSPRAKRHRLLGDQILWIDRGVPPAAFRAPICDYVSLPWVVRHGRTMREARRTAYDALERVDAWECGQRDWISLSRWERLLVELARCVAVRPRLMLIDDLFDGLGARRTQEAGRLLRSLVDELECGVLLSVSDLESALVADRALCIGRGKLSLMPDVFAHPNVVDLMSRSGGSDRSFGCGYESAATTRDATVPTQSPDRIETMPAISRFLGITVAMYFDDHQPPHFHARSGEFSAKIRTDTCELLTGDLPRRELRLVLAWAELHTSELQDNWRRAREGETLQPIEPLQ